MHQPRSIGLPIFANVALMCISTAAAPASVSLLVTAAMVAILLLSATAISA